MDQGGNIGRPGGPCPLHQGQHEQHQEERLFGQQHQHQHDTVHDQQYQQNQQFEQQAQCQRGYGQDEVHNRQQDFQIFRQQQSEQQFDHESNQFEQPLQYQVQDQYLDGQLEQNHHDHYSQQHGYQEQQFSGQFQYEHQEHSHQHPYEEYAGYHENMNSDNMTIGTTKTGWTGKTGSTGISGLTGASVVGDSGGSRGYISGSYGGYVSRNASAMSAVLEEGEECLEEDGEKQKDESDCGFANSQDSSERSAKPRATPLTKRVSQGTTEIANNLTRKKSPDGINITSDISNVESDISLNVLNGRRGKLKSILRSSTTGQSKLGGITNLRASTRSIGTIRSSHTEYSGFTSQKTGTTQSVLSVSTFPYLGTIKSATREISVADIDFLIHADEEVSLPESYLNYCPNDDDRIIPGKYATHSIVPIPEDDPTRSIKLRSNEYIALEYPRTDAPKDISPFSTKRRNHTFFTAVMALSLAVVGLYMAVVSVSSGYYSDPATTQSSSSYGFSSLLSPGMANSATSGYNYVPGYQFGGGIGGFIGGQEREMRIQMGMNQNNFYASNIGEEDYDYVPHPGDDKSTVGNDAGGGNAPMRVSRSFSIEGNGRPGHHGYEYNREDLRDTISDLSRTGMSNVKYHTRMAGSIASTLSRATNARTGLGTSPKIRNYSGKPPDPFHGYGPPQFNPDYAIAPQGGLSLRTTLTSEPMTSYTPPPSDDDGSSASLPMLLDPKFHGSFLDLSVLPYNPIREVPVVWDMPLSGAEAVQTIFGNCLKLVLCSREGALILQSQFEQYQKEVQAEEKHALRKKLEERMLEDHQRLRMQLVVDRPGGDVVYYQNHHDPTSPRNLLQIVEKSKYNEEENGEILEVTKMNSFMENSEISHGSTLFASVPIDFDPPLDVKFSHTSTHVNVDCSTPRGINRGITHNLATSVIMDVIFSPNIYDVARLFAPPTEAYGRAVVLVRHPLERAVAAYENFKVVNKEKYGGMTLPDYVESEFFEDNILTRSLSGNFGTPLAKEDVYTAKEVLKRKFIVGLYDRMQESLERFEKFFGWNLNIEAQKCQETEVQREISKQSSTKIYSNGDENEGAHPNLTSSELASLAERNRVDLSLFEFVKFLFAYQGRVLFGVLEDN